MDEKKTNIIDTGLGSRGRRGKDISSGMANYAESQRMHPISRYVPAARPPKVLTTSRMLRPMRVITELVFCLSPVRDMGIRVSLCSPANSEVAVVFSAAWPQDGRVGMHSSTFC
jgi:hypothetical protein